MVGVEEEKIMSLYYKISLTTMIVCFFGTVPMGLAFGFNAMCYMYGAAVLGSAAFLIGVIWGVE